MIDAVRGLYSRGSNNATDNLAHVASHIAALVGLETFHPGTFNVTVAEHYPLTSVDGVVPPERYLRQQECIKVRRCRVRLAEEDGAGIRAVIIRPSQHEHPGRERLWLRLELMCPKDLKATLKVSYGDEVVVEVEAENARHDQWWGAADAWPQ